MARRWFLIGSMAMLVDIILPMINGRPLLIKISVPPI